MTISNVVIFDKLLPFMCIRAPRRTAWCVFLLFILIFLKYIWNFRLFVGLRIFFLNLIDRTNGKN